MVIPAGYNYIAWRIDGRLHTRLLPKTANWIARTLWMEEMDTVAQLGGDGAPWPTQ